MNQRGPAKLLELLWRLKFIFDIKDTGLYRDNCVILLRKTSQRNTDRLRKEQIRFLKDHEVNITTIINAKVFNSLYVTLDLNNGYSKPYTKARYVSNDSVQF